MGRVKGFEPSSFSLGSYSADDATIGQPDGCENAKNDLAECLAVLSENQPDLARVAAVWKDLPEHVRQAILMLVEGGQSQATPSLRAGKSISCHLPFRYRLPPGNCLPARKEQRKASR